MKTLPQRVVIPTSRSRVLPSRLLQGLDVNQRSLGQ